MPWPPTGTGRLAGCRAPAARRSRTRRGWTRAGASRPSGHRWSPRCRARRRASRGWSRRRSRPGPSSPAHQMCTPAAGGYGGRPPGGQLREIGQYRRQFWCRRRGRLRGDGKLTGDRQEPGPRVTQQFCDAVAAKHRRDRHRDRAYPHGGEVNDGEVRRVRHHHQDPLLGLDPGGPQPRRGPADPVPEAGVAEVARRAGQGQPVAVSGGEPPVEQVLTRVEQLRHACAPGSWPGLRPGARSRSRRAGR